MPKVPVYDSPQVDSRPIGTPYESGGASPTDFGAGVGQGLEQVGAAVDHVGQVIAEHKKQADVAQVEAKLGEFQDAATAAVTQMKAAKGENAAAQSGQAMIDLGDKLNDFANNQLANDEQKALFAQYANKVFRQARAHIEGHVAAENEVAKTEKFEALAKSQIDNVAVTGDIPAAVAMMRGPLEIEAARRGLPEEAAARFKDEYLQKLALERAKAFIASGDGEAAQKFIESEMPGSTRYDPMTGKARAGTVREVLGAAGESVIHQAQIAALDQKAGERAQAIFGSSIDPKSKMIDEGLARAKWDAMPPGKLKDETGHRLDHRIQIADAEHKRDNEALFSQALSAVLQNGTEAAIPPAVKARLLDPTNQGGPDLYEKLRVVLRTQAAHALNAPPTAAQLTAMNEFRAFIVENPSDAAKLTQEQFNARWLPRLARKDWESAGAHLAEVKSSFGKSGAVDLGKLDKIVTETAGGIPELHDAVKVKALKAAMLERYSDYAKANPGKPVPAAEVEAMLADELLTTKGHWYSGAKFKFQVEPGKFEAGPAEEQKFRPNKKSAPAAPATGPHGKFVMQKGVRYDWNPTTGSYE